MKRLNLKRPEYSILALLAVVLLIGYQNCSNSMSFDGGGLTAGKIDTVAGGGDINDDPLPNIGDGGSGNPPGTTPSPGATPNPTVMLPPPTGDDDTQIDYDHENHRIAFSCTTGATLDFNRAELEAANDLTLKNEGSFVFNYTRPLRNVFVENLKGSIGIKNALRIQKFQNISGLVSYIRAIDIDEIQNIHGGITVAAGQTVRGIQNVHSGYICGSGSEIGKISDLHALYAKFRGRPTKTTAGTNVNGRAGEISNIHAELTSIYELDISRLTNIHSGEIIIRNSVIDNVENFHGGLTLINSKVKNLKNASGTLRLLNSTIDSESNTNLKRVDLK